MITYSEPKKETFKTIIEKYEDGKLPTVLEFDNTAKAWSFLNIINVYVDGKLMNTTTYPKDLRKIKKHGKSN
jgi:hypothetical protein